MVGGRLAVAQALLDQVNHAARAGVQAYDSAASLCAASDIVISAVTASNTLAVAEAAARLARDGALRRALFRDLAELDAYAATGTEPAEDDPAFDCRIHGNRICGPGNSQGVPPGQYRDVQPGTTLVSLLLP